MLTSMGARGRRACIVLLALPLLALSGPSRASACGGLFCDRPQSTPDAFGNPPPSQSGEEIVYGMESDGSLVMSVRIFYQGAAPEFAWILPVPTNPVLSLGTDVLFSTLETGTQPYFRLSYAMTGTCAPDPRCVSPDSGFRAYDAAVSASDAARDAGGGPTIEQMSTLGPYETVVLTATTGAEVRTWLGDHAYVIPAESVPLLDAYASQGSHFVALRLRSDASIDQIQPITLTMPATSPCLPIRLTSFATQPDLSIIAFFLADARAVSSNYSMIDPDWADVGLYTGATSYSSYVTRAVDAAGGHAFVTDYSGATTAAALGLPSVADLATESDPATFLRRLSSLGYAADPQILAILADYLVPPAGMTPRAYYNCLIYGTPFTGFDAGVSACGAPTSFDPMGAVTAIDQTITRPRQDAQDLLARHPTTTRLYTTLSADEMTLDPEFRLDPALHPVGVERSATHTTACDSGHYEDEAGGYYTTSAGVVFGQYAPQTHSGPDAWCTRHGQWWTGASTPDGGHYPDGAVAPPRVASGGGGCSVARGTPSAWLALALVVLAAQVRRRRSRHALPAASPSRSRPGTIAPSVVP